MSPPAEETAEGVESRPRRGRRAATRAGRRPRGRRPRAARRTSSAFQPDLASTPPSSSSCCCGPLAVRLGAAVQGPARPRAQLEKAFQDAEQARAEAAALLAQHSSQMEQAAEQVRTILDEARRDARPPPTTSLRRPGPRPRPPASGPTATSTRPRTSALMEIWTSSADLAAAVATPGPPARAESRRTIAGSSSRRRPSSRPAPPATARRARSHEHRSQPATAADVAGRSSRRAPPSWPAPTPRPSQRRRQSGEGRGGARRARGVDRRRLARAARVRHDPVSTPASGPSEKDRMLVQTFEGRADAAGLELPARPEPPRSARPFAGRCPKGPRGLGPAAASAVR